MSTSKTKSPPAPSRSLGDCFEDTQKLYQQYSHSTFSKAEVASLFKISVASGAFYPRLFALKEYGLIEQVHTDGYKVSRLFLEMKGLEQDDPAFKQHALACINKAEIFGTILRDFKTRLPSSQMLAQRLETQMKFNPDRAKVTATILEKSLHFAGVLDRNNNILPIRSEVPKRDSATDDEDDAYDTKHLGRAIGEATEEEKNSRDTIVVQSSGQLKMEVPLANKRRVTILYPEDISVEEAEKIKKMLEAFTTILEAMVA